ncbi:hypothetical protein AHAS_Ahas01G0174100 [Arachis hypogaea]
MASLAGGYHNVPYTTRDMHNVNAKQRREGGLDAESCLSTSQIYYQVFGDVVAFDATYKENIYLSPLVVFSGVNHHNQTVVFAAALVADEKKETYVWLLQQLQTSMKGKAPVSIITNGDRQMKLRSSKFFQRLTINFMLGIYSKTPRATSESLNSPGV